MEVGGADINPISDAGVPAFGIMQDGRTYFNYHHTAADTLEKAAAIEFGPAPGNCCHIGLTFF